MKEFQQFCISGGEYHQTFALRSFDSIVVRSMKEQGKEGQLFSLNLGPRHMKISEVELEKVLIHNKNIHLLSTFLVVHWIGTLSCMGAGHVFVVFFKENKCAQLGKKKWY
jgi:hypothetical protein